MGFGLKDIKEKPAEGGQGGKKKIKKGEVEWFNLNHSFITTTSPS